MDNAGKTIGFDLDGNQMAFALDALDDPGQQDGEIPTENPEETEKPDHLIKITHRYARRHISRKASSEMALEKQLNWYFEEGDCYHCLSFGDVDTISYIKHILHQQRILYLAVSTWVIAGEDVDDLREWYRRGYIGRVDFYLGEIFAGSRPEIYDSVYDFVQECGGRIVVFRNHAKVIIVVGERFDCLIESSANVNTNPRAENTVLTVDRQLVRDYIELFNGINSFYKATREVPKYIIPDRGGEG